MKNFTQIPNELLQSSQLSVSERYLYCVLLRYCHATKDFCFPSQITLAKVLGVTDRHIRSLLIRLEKKGFIRRTRHGWGKPNTYEIAKSLVAHRNSTSYVIGNKFPFQSGNAVPPNNTYVKRKEKSSNSRGMENLREIIDQIRHK